MVNMEIKKTIRIEIKRVFDEEGYAKITVCGFECNKTKDILSVIMPNIKTGNMDFPELNHECSDTGGHNVRYGMQEAKMNFMETNYKANDVFPEIVGKIKTRLEKIIKFIDETRAKAGTETAIIEIN